METKKMFNGISNGQCILGGKAVSPDKFAQYLASENKKVQEQFGLEKKTDEELLANAKVTVAKAIATSLGVATISQEAAPVITPKAEAPKPEAAKPATKDDRIAHLHAAREAWFKAKGYGKYRTEKGTERKPRERKAKAADVVTLTHDELAALLEKAKAAPKARNPRRERFSQLAAAREAYFKKMGFGKFAKKKGA